MKRAYLLQFLMVCTIALSCASSFAYASIHFNPNEEINGYCSSGDRPGLIPPGSVIPASTTPVSIDPAYYFLAENSVAIGKCTTDAGGWMSFRSNGTNSPYMSWIIETFSHVFSIKSFKVRNTTGTAVPLHITAQRDSTVIYTDTQQVALEGDSTITLTTPFENIDKIKIAFSGTEDILGLSLGQMSVEKYPPPPSPPPEPAGVPTFSAWVLLSVSSILAMFGLAGVRRRQC